MFIINQLKKTASLDLRSLALFRIFLGMLIIGDLLIRLRDLRIFYSDEGTLPISQLPVLTIINSTFSFHTANGSWEFQLFMFLIALLFGIFLLFGYKTTLSTLISWILLVSLQNRNPIILQGGDVVFRLILFWAIFLPIGKRFSVDAFKKDYIEVFKDNRVLSISTLALILQIGFVYFFAALLKTGDEWRQDYTATYFALSLDSFSTWFGRILLDQFNLLKVLTFSVWWAEFCALWFLIFPIFNFVFRTIAIVALFGLHFGLMMSMYLGHFPWVMFVCLSALIPTETWDFVIRFIEKRLNFKKIVISYNPTVNIQSKFIKFICIFFVMRKVEFKESKESFEVKKNKTTYSGVDALEVIFKNSLIFHWFSFIFKIKFVGRIINKIRVIIGKSLKRSVTEGNLKVKELTHDNFFKFFIYNFISSIAIMLIFFWNVSTVVKTVNLDQPFYNAVMFLRLDQEWNMFAPYPLKEDGWFVVTGFYNDGEEKNLLGTPKDTRYERPKNIADEYKNERWRKYMLNLWAQSFADHRVYYLSYLCREENKITDDINKPILTKIEMEYMEEFSQLPGIETSTRQIFLQEYNCL
jgi:hypothetical protein